MNILESLYFWNNISVIGKGITYLLAMACMVKYLII